MEIRINGKAAYYNTGGVEWRKGQPTLCLIHGASLDHSVWVLLTRYFARHGYNVIAPDLPGHGHSEGEAVASIDAYASWINQLMSACDCEEVRLAGHSMGSLVALAAAGQQPQRISHLVLLGTAFPMPVGAALLDAAKDNHHAAIDMVTGYGHSFRSHLGGNPVAGINIYQSAVALMEAAGSGVLHADMLACDQYSDGFEAASRLLQAGDCRCELILGEHDQMTRPAGARELAAALQARVTVLKDCGHMLMSEQPEETLQALLRAMD